MSRYMSMSDTLRQKNAVDAACVVNVEVAEERRDPERSVKLWFVDISDFGRTSQFLLLSTAVFASYLIYGYLQELIFRLKEFRPFGWYLTLVQFLCYLVFGLLEMQVRNNFTRKIPMKMYALLAFLTVATMGLSNTSVGYLNYPTQVIFKCCKLIPVMVGSILIQGRRYNCIDVSAMMCMIVGLILFTLADSSVSPNFNTYGVILISLALCADGAIGNVQEKAMKQYEASNTEIVFYSYGLGFFYILVGLLLSGNFFPAFEFCKQHPVQTYGYGFLFSISGYVGLAIVLTLVKTFGALIAVTVTTCRKAVTIILSFLFFSKPFTLQYVWSGLLVVLGIYLNVYSKNRKSWDKVISDTVTKVEVCFKSKRGNHRHILTDV
ncbi:adenosine 3'-phospho 5'-phosphosulfate transporter 2-like [Saccostrea echinata]|uniref:adenosine 3'-phospho 5'-phosphosulfate transporter 2-like n=1 Tax=Saccostrea echinata TaxID=191078 RepID=UPI002A7F28FD|nr:adenosine 3'-phospho 5'-phosphosulfate transporter 2-like [Saccostrea echinata]